jgi:hypothetical protein
MGFEFIRLVDGDDGETHLVEVDLPLSFVPGSDVSVAPLPVTKMTYVEYPEDREEITPGWHPTPHPRHFMMSVVGGFEITTTSGDTRRFGPGDWVLCDDLTGKGHITRGLPGRRVNLVIDVPDDWEVPEG